MSKDKLIPELRFPEFKNEGEWDKPTLSSVCNVIMGSSPSSSSYNENKIGLPLLQGNADIKNRLSAPRIYTTEITKECEIGDILLSVRAPVGTVAKSLHNACIGRGLSSIRAKKPNSQEYIYQCLFSYESSWAKISQGGTFDAVNSDDIRNLLIPIPKEKEQQKIASCLSSLDEVIAAHSQKLELLKDHKKGLMQNLFPQEGEKEPKYRFKEFEKDGEWVQTSVEENCLVKGRIGYRGYTTEDLVGQGEGALVLGGKHIQNQLLELKDPTYLSWEKYYESPEIMVEVGDIIFSQRGSLGDCAIIDKGIGPATINPSMVLLKNITCDAKFLYYILIGNRIQNEVHKNKAMGAIPMISQKQIKEFPFLIPKPNEQQKIASCLSSLDALISAQAEKIEQLKLHKMGLMQGLFPKIKE